jgi:hypothetical protein
MTRTHASDARQTLPLRSAARSKATCEVEGDPPEEGRRSRSVEREWTRLPIDRCRRSLGIVPCRVEISRRPLGLMAVGIDSGGNVRSGATCP